jgi:hypothetical protein
VCLVWGHLNDEQLVSDSRDRLNSLFV